MDDLLNPNITPWNDIRTNYYHAVTSSQMPPGSMRLTEHSDWGTLTFLAQDECGGLEGKMKIDEEKEEWIPVPPKKGSILLNSGLMLEVWSGGKFPGTGGCNLILYECL